MAAECNDDLYEFSRHCQLTIGDWTRRPTSVAALLLTSRILERIPRCNSSREFTAVAEIMERLAWHLLRCPHGDCSTYNPDTSAWLARRACAWILGHFNDRPVTLTRLARELGITAPHLCRVLRIETMTTFRTHLERVRVLEATLLLADSSLRVKEVAHRAGFGSTAELDRAFRRVVATKPSVFRQLLARD